MADSPRIPPSQVGKPSSPANVLGEQSARVVRLPDALMTVSRSVRVEGEVVRQNSDGTVRINTPQGNVDVQVRGKQPQPGQRLEVDIPAGRPPRQVTIRPAPTPAPDIPVQVRPSPQIPVPIQTRPAAPTPGTPQPAPPAQGQAPQGPVAPRPAPQPMPQTPPPAGGSSPPPQTQQPAPLPPGAAVRFLPATPAQAQQIVQSVAQMTLSLPTAATRLAFAANLIAQSAQDNVTRPLLQAKPGDIQAMAQQIRQAGTMPSTGNAAMTPAANLLRQIMTMNLSHTPTAPATSGSAATAALTQMTALPATPMVMPATGAATAIPTAQLLAIPAGTDTPGLPPAFARIAQMDVRVLNIQPPLATLSQTASGTPQPGGLPIPTATPQTPAGALVAQVVGFTPNNLPLVSITPPGGLPQNFILQFNAGNLQVGTTLTLQPQNVQVAAPGTPTGATAATPMTPRLSALLSLFGPGPWPVMDETYQTLLQTAPATAQAFARVLPSPANPSQLGTAALLFIAAVRSGDIGSWLGDKKIDALSRGGKNNLLTRLTQDLSTLAQRTADAPAVSNDWRPVPLPLFWEGHIQKIALYVKQDGGNNADSERDGTGQTRFIFDLDLDRMGGVQLDGLVRDKRFDLVVRTQAPLSDNMRQMMKQNYSNALQSTELHGELSFQGDIKNWVNVLQKDEAFGASA